VIATDIREGRFVEHTLQLAIQATLDIASQIVSARRLGEPETNRALFDRLLRAGLVDGELADTLDAMARFRNILVHGYQEVDHTVVRKILDHHLDDLLAFTRAIRQIDA